MCKRADGRAALVDAVITLALNFTFSPTVTFSSRLFGPMTLPAPIFVSPRRMVPGRMTAPGAISTVSSMRMPSAE